MQFSFERFSAFKSLWLMVALVVACGGDGGGPSSNVIEEPGEVARVNVTPLSVTLPTGGTAQMTAEVLDAANRKITGRTVSWSSGNNSVATVTSQGLVTAVATGTADIVAALDGKSGSASVTVSGTAPQGNVISVNPTVTYQTITGWQTHAQDGWLECNATAYSAYRAELHNRAVNELGINRLSIPVRSGVENTRDHHKDFATGVTDWATYRTTWFAPVNDNSNPMSADASKFYWSYLDGYIDNSVLPVKQLLQARGEKLYLVLQYIDFRQPGVAKPFVQLKQPQEYAEVVVVAFQHLKSKYGLVPDAFEMLLEPEHTDVYAPDLGRALVAVSARLKTAGFDPVFIAPSTTSMINASTYYDEMIQIPGAGSLIGELAYHRYVGVSLPALQAIATRSLRDGVKTSMLEHIGSGIDALIEDLTVGNASSWMQFAMGYCSNDDKPDDGSVYYHINQSNPASPRVVITNHSKLLRQVFAYVRLNARRVGATSGNPGELKPVAFVNTNGKQVVVVRTNRSSSMTIQGLAAGTYGVNYGTSGSQWDIDLPDQTIAAGGTIQVSIPAAGAITVYGK